MKLRCPVCGGEFTLDQAAQAQDLVDLSELAASFGPDWLLVAEYLDCFRYRKDGALAVKKRLRLARDMKKLFNTCMFQYGGEIYRVSLPDIKEALAQVANREMLGLKNHNYLKQILKAAAEKLSRREERVRKEREDRLRSGITEDGRPVHRGAVPEAVGEIIGSSEPPDPEWMAEFSRLNLAVIRAKAPEEKTKARAEFQAHLKKRQGK
jgi:hypothetical protein